MEKRSAKIGGYVTADHGWTLAGVSLTAPEQKTNYIEKTGGDGSWDLSTVMTDGIPRYKNRTLTVTLENSQGTREEREALISDLVNRLDGLEHRIELPDHPDHFLVGRVHVSVEYSTLAHARVVITGTVEPWFYKNFETVVTLDAPITSSTEAATFNLWNRGRKVVTPRLEVVGTAHLGFGDYRIDLETGSYTAWSALRLAPGLNELVYTGSTGGTVTLTYREAVLR